MFYMRDTFPLFPIGIRDIPGPWNRHSPKSMESKVAHERKMKYYFFNYTKMRLYNYHRNTFYLSNIEHKSLLLYLISEEPDPEEYPVVLIINTEGRSPDGASLPTHRVDASTLSMPENSNFQYWCRFTTENLYDIYDMIDTEEITPTFEDGLPLLDGVPLPALRADAIPSILNGNKSYHITSVEIRDMNIC